MDTAEIKEGLKLPGKSRVGLAATLGIDVSQISRLLNGKRHLKVCELPRIREYLYGDPASLLSGNDPDTTAPSARRRLAHLEAIRLLLDEAERHDVDAPSIIMKALRDAIDATKSEPYGQDNEDCADPADPYDQRATKPGVFGRTVHN